LSSWATGGLSRSTQIHGCYHWIMNIRSPQYKLFSVWTDIYTGHFQCYSFCLKIRWKMSNIGWHVSLTTHLRDKPLVVGHASVVLPSVRRWGRCNRQKATRFPGRLGFQPLCVSRSPAVEHILRHYPFKAQWLLYVPPSLTYQNSAFCSQTVIMCFHLRGLCLLPWREMKRVLTRKIRPCCHRVTSSCLVNCCWPSPAQSFLVSGPAGHKTHIFLRVTWSHIRHFHARARALHLF
jgi:hypothetical protein